MKYLIESETGYMGIYREDYSIIIELIEYDSKKNVCLSFEDTNDIKDIIHTLSHLSQKLEIDFNELSKDIENFQKNNK